MPYAGFHELFPDVAVKETRSITILTAGELPRGSYGFLELFCNEEECDCRRVFIQAVSAEHSIDEPLATISFGWEDAAFYRDWASFPMSNDDLHEIKGPALVRLAPQSKYSAALLHHFEALVRDKDYVNRIVRHYQMFRAAIDKAAARSKAPVVHAQAKLGRNAPCPCGSGRKFKKCCSEKREPAAGAIQRT